MGSRRDKLGSAHLAASRVPAENEAGSSSCWHQIRHDLDIGERRRNRRLAVVLALPIAATLATGAYGIVRVLGPFGDPAPRSPHGVSHRPDNGARRGSPRPLAIPEQTIVEIGTSDGGRASISTRPAEGEALCWYMIKRGGSGVGGGAVRCRYDEDQPEETNPFELLLLSNEVLLLGGEVPPHVAALELRFGDGTSANVAVVQDFFIYEVPSSHYAPGLRPVSLVARDAAGDEVGETGFCWTDVPSPPARASAFCPA